MQRVKIEVTFDQAHSQNGSGILWPQKVCAVSPSVGAMLSSWNVLLHPYSA